MASNYPTTTTAGVLGNGGNVTDAHHGVWSPVDVAGRYERTIAGLLSAYGPPATFGIGIVGHVTSLFVLSRLYGNLPSTSLYLIVGLVIDLPVLYVRSGNASIKQLTKEQLDVVNTARHWSEILCKLVPFASDTTLHLSVWLVAAAAIETAVVHRCRQRRRQEAPVVVSRTRRRSKQRMQHQTDVSRAVILLLVVLIVCINAHCFWTHTFVPVDVGGVPQVGRRLAAGGERVCIAGVRPNGIGGGGSGGAGSGKQSDEVFRSFVWPLVNLCVTHVGPFAVIAVSTLVALTVRCRRRSRLSNGQRQAPHQQLHRRLQANSDDDTNANDVATVEYRHELYAAVLALAVYHLVVLSPDMVACVLTLLWSSTNGRIGGAAVSTEQQQQPGPQRKEELSATISHDQFFTVVTSFLFQVYFASKVFILFVSWPAFRRQLIALLTCGFGPPMSSGKVAARVKSSGCDQNSARTPAKLGPETSSTIGGRTCGADDAIKQGPPSVSVAWTQCSER